MVSPYNVFAFEDLFCFVWGVVHAAYFQGASVVVVVSTVQSVTRFERFIDNMFVLFDSCLAFTSSIKSGNSFPWWDRLLWSCVQQLGLQSSTSSLPWMCSCFLIKVHIFHNYRSLTITMQISLWSCSSCSDCDNGEPLQPWFVFSQQIHWTGRSISDLWISPLLS